jgi:hypothetical protein
MQSVSEGDLAGLRGSKTMRMFILPLDKKQSAVERGDDVLRPLLQAGSGGLKESIG